MGEWRPVVGFEGLYEVSDDGAVRKCDGLILAQTVSRSKHITYRQVTLRKGGKHYRKTVHRLVAEAFLQNPDMRKIVNHKDENGENNAVSNLEWCDRSYNARYGSSLEKIRQSLVGNRRRHMSAVNKKVGGSNG